MFCFLSVTAATAEICFPDPGSLLANGSFQGSGCWVVDEAPQGVVNNVYFTGSFYAEISDGASNVELKQIVSVEEGETYQVSFVAWVQPDTSEIAVAVQQDNAPWESCGLWRIVRVQPASKRIVCRFTCTRSDPHARFSIYLQNVHGGISISNARFEDITCDQNALLVNPDFDCNPAFPVGWSTFSNGQNTVFSTETGAYNGTYCCRVDALPGASYYDSFIEQPYLSWTANRYYLLRFWARGEDTAHHEIFSLTDDSSSVVPVWMEDTLQPAWSVHPFVFRATTTVNETGRLRIMNGALNGSAQYDAAQLVEVPMPDFNVGGKTFFKDVTGDGKADCVYFELRDRWLTWVARSNGSGYGPFELWCGPCAPATAVPIMGNWNGVDADSLRRQDIAWVDAPNGLVIVRLSDGNGFYDPGTNPWYLGPIPTFGAVRSGDVDDDGDDDLVIFTLGTAADVYALLSTTASFIPPAKWHDYFGLTGEYVFTGDFNGDGKFDIITFIRKNEGYVCVALSNGTSFGNGPVWAGLFCIHDEIPAVGDLNNDGKWDIVSYVHQDADRRVWGKLSTGTGFGSSLLLHGYIAGASDDPDIADLNGDGMTDAVAMNTISYSIVSARSWGLNFGDLLTWYTTETMPEVPLPIIPQTSDVSMPVPDTSRSLALRCFPSPLHTTATITLHLDAPVPLKVEVYDVAGRRRAVVFNGQALPGVRQFLWHAGGVPAGLYLCRASTPSVAEIQRLIVLR
ncbi:MAG: FG-GAP-like repeat-containing protein [bacterium]